MLGRERDRVDKLWLVTDDGRTGAGACARRWARDPSLQVLRVPRDALAAWLQPEPGMRSRTTCTWSIRWATG